jgi:hypothetical protein
LSIANSWALVSDGLTASINAATAATWGEAMLVPLRLA